MLQPGKPSAKMADVSSISAAETFCVGSDGGNSGFGSDGENAGFAALIAEPQCAQNLLPASFAAPHFGQGAFCPAATEFIKSALLLASIAIASFKS